MLMPSRFYRRLKVVYEWWDDDLQRPYTTRKTIDLGDVNSFEESVGGRLDVDNIKRTHIYFTGNKPPITIRMSYDEFDKIFEQYHSESGTLDNRTQKKRLNYTGPMKYCFDKDVKFLVTTSYPQNFSFINKAPDEVYDAVLFSCITPMN